MYQLVEGQRWFSKTEPELGVGTLVEIKDRTICIRFDLCDCIRQYTIESAPLKRLVFKPGDNIQLKNDNSLIIETVSESKGLLYYSGRNNIVCEKDLSDTISFSMPLDRLFAGITDSCKLFDLRCLLLKSRAEYDASLAKGFLGGQVQLIPHQFFIADKVTSRYIPRVLLSDETGLGKTIEACLILHKLLMTFRVKRVLVVVPESLVHQWFIELYRKFNLSFMIFNEDYCLSLEQEGQKTNPFLEHQLGILSMDFLKSKKRQTQVFQAPWDMLVIDEAHHITDDENSYGFIKSLARKVFGLMLLTATPEQMGVKNHFLHLKLLDPERYFDFNNYLNETARYKKTIKKIHELVKKGKTIDHILDSYGPGRVIFRNKRSVVKGFPKRVARLKSLRANPSQIKAANQEFIKDIRICDFKDDPRISYLVELIKQKKKILVICSSKEKVETIDKAVAKHISLDVARFDETMSLLQRDRNAAWFSRKDGAKMLICSEIGSEGRNFQFVHHLFLFDLPLNPELLEQRIGRVDRIGQKKKIKIHVPYLKTSMYEILARWYMEGLNLFEKNINGVHLIYKKFEKNLQDLLKQSKNMKGIEQPLLDKLILETKAYCTKVDKELDQGKNVLLEMNSFKPESAKTIIDHIVQRDKNKDLETLLIQVLDHYGIETDFIDKTIFKLDSNNMTDETFPERKSLSDIMTFDRPTAIVRDDVDFFSWDHPFVRNTIEYFTTNGTGSCATALLKGENQTGVMLETVFILECIAPKDLNIERYLMADPIHIIVDHKGNNISLENQFRLMSKNITQDNSTWYQDLDQLNQILIPSLMKQSVLIAKDRSQVMIKNGRAQAKQILGKEITRLCELKKINPDISQKEIKLAQNFMDLILEHLSFARARIDAVRLIRVQ
ncbi:MAG: DEAD/DEAH box helicase family protein [Desulfobacula sp.]|nr:DEAD/DEAH box helicase family protein [Desulfobacula sp.]